MGGMSVWMGARGVRFVPRKERRAIRVMAVQSQILRSSSGEERRGNTMRGKYAFKVRTYECGADGRATMPTICNYLQEAASVHAEELGFSKSDFDAAGENLSWVLTRMVVKMLRYPEWKDDVTVETFPRGGRRIVAWRDFVVKDASGEVIGLATSEWMIIDLATRRASAIPESVLALVPDMPDSVLGAEPFTARLRFPQRPEGDAEAPLSFRAQNAHIDLNGHVNNVHYIEWLLEPLRGVAPRELEIVFRSETLAGDEVSVEVAAGTAPGEMFHRVFAADGKDHAVARTVS